MNDKLLNFIKELQNDRRLFTLGEAAIRQSVVLKILSCLKWDTFNTDEVYPEFSIKNKRVDLALRYNGHNKAEFRC